MSYLGTDKTPVNIRRKNYIINGNFDIWQRAITQSASGYGSDDRWLNTVAGGTTAVHFQQPFQLGQVDVPNNPKYYSRAIVTSGSATNSNFQKFQKIENVVLSSSTMFTLSFYAKAETSKNIAVDFWQDFGTGGSPSTAISGIGVTTFALTTNWQKFTKTVTYPSITGKTLGTNNNSNFGFSFWYAAGSTLNSRTNSLGNQNGTFDLAQIQLEVGTFATDFEYRNLSTELSLCQRYYEERATSIVQKIGTFSNNAGAPPVDTVFKVEKRVTPSISKYTNSTKATTGFLINNTTVSTNFTGSSFNTQKFTMWGGDGTYLTTVGDYWNGYITIDAEL